MGIHVALGSALHTAGTTLWSLRGRASLAKWQTELEQREKSLAIERQRIKLLVETDDGYRNYPKTAIAIDAVRPSYARWTDDRQIAGTFEIAFRNQWFNRTVITKMASSFSLQNTRLGNLENFIEDKTVGAFSYTAASIRREFQWTPSADDRRSWQLSPEAQTVLQITVNVHAYFGYPPEQFDIEASPSIDLVIQPMCAGRKPL